MSMVVAFTVTPWLAYRALRGRAASSADEEQATSIEETLLYRFYARLLAPFLDDRRRAWALLGGVTLLFVGGRRAGAAPRGAAQDAALRQQERVPDRGEPARGHHARAHRRGRPEPGRGAAARARGARLRDLQRARLADGLQRHGASLLPAPGAERGRHPRQPGRRSASARCSRTRSRCGCATRSRPSRAMRAPGSRSSRCRPDRRCSRRSRPRSTASRSFPTRGSASAARAVERRLALEPGVSDVDSTVEDDVGTLALRHRSGEGRALRCEYGRRGDDRRARALRSRRHASPPPGRGESRCRSACVCARPARSGVEALHALALKGQPGIVKVREAGGVRDAPVPVVRLGELGEFVAVPAEKAIYHKDLRRVVYVYAEPVGRAPAEVVADVEADLVPAGAPSGGGCAARPAPARGPDLPLERRRNPLVAAAGCRASPGSARASSRSRATCSAISASPSGSRCSASTSSSSSRPGATPCP